MSPLRPFLLLLPLAALGRAAEAANAMEIATALNNQVNLQAARFHMMALSGDPVAAREVEDLLALVKLQVDLRL